MKIKETFNNIFSALFFPLVAFILIPINIISKNFYFTEPNWLVYLIFLSLFLISFFVLFLLLRCKSDKCFTVFKIFIFFGFGVLIFDSLKIYTMALRWRHGAIIEALTLIALAFFVFKYLKIRHLSFISLISLALLLTTLPGVINIAKMASNSGRINSQSKTPARGVAGNVYHIILDEFQSDAYNYIINKDKNFMLDGFVYYKDFHTNYGLTYLSLPNIFTGKVYSEGMSYRDWQKNYISNGFLSGLTQNGVGVSYYAELYEESKLPFIVFMRSAQLRENASWAFYSDLLFRRLLPYTLLGVLDKFGHDETVSVDPKSGTYGFSLTNFWGFMGAQVQNEGSLALFEKMLEHETHLPSSGRYVFCHLMIPHKPYLFDKNGNPLTPGNNFANYLKQVEFTINTIKRFINVLKKLNRFDDSLIILQGDHGSYWKSTYFKNAQKYNTEEMRYFYQDKNKDLSKLSNVEIESASSALLLIKPPLSTGFLVSDARVTSTDIAPSVLSHFKIVYSDFDGIPLQGVAAIDLQTQNRNPVFFQDTYLNDGALENDYFPDKILKYTMKNPGKWTLTNEITPIK